MAAGTPADIIIAVSRQPTKQGDFALYVHSVRASHFDAATLFAPVRQPPGRNLHGASNHVASIR